MISSNEKKPDDTVHYVPATDASISVLSSPHSSPITNSGLEVLQDEDPTATTDAGMKFSQSVDKGKSKRHVGYLFASSSLLSSLTVVGAFRDAASLLDLVAESENGYKPTWDLRSSLLDGRYIIERHYKIDFGRFGEDYARGDSQARAQMEAVFMTLSSILLPSLKREVTNRIPSFYVYAILRSESEDNRGKAAACLGALSNRLSVAAVAENSLPSEVNMPYPMVSNWTPETLVYPDGWPVVPKSLGDWGPLSSANQPHDGSAPSTVPAMSIVVEESTNGGTPDIDMDRFSAMSLAPSSLSGFSSLRSLARRIRFRNASSDRYSMDDPPSNAMIWNRSSGSLELFGQLPNRLSMASSQESGNSRMSWRPEIPVTVAEDDTVTSEGLLARFRRPRNGHDYTPEEEEDFMKAISRPLAPNFERPRSVQDYAPKEDENFMRAIPRPSRENPEKGATGSN